MIISNEEELTNVLTIISHLTKEYSIILEGIPEDSDKMSDLVKSVGSLSAINTLDKLYCMLQENKE